MPWYDGMKVMAIIAVLAAYSYILIEYGKDIKQAQYEDIAAKAQKEIAKKQAVINQLEIDLATVIVETKVVFRDIEKEVIKYVETSPIIECFDDSAVWLLQKAASGDELPQTP